MDRKTLKRERIRRGWEELIDVMKIPMRYKQRASLAAPATVTSAVGGETPACKRRITSWEQLIDAMNIPMRYPEFPELASTGIWRPWTAEPEIQQSQSSAVDQPKVKFSSIRRRARLDDEQHDVPLQFEGLPAGHIRLLDLRKATMDDDILVGFKLVTVPLYTAPKFVALSYCWGSTHLCTGIFVSTPTHENQVYRVTENLAACLHSLLVLRKRHIRYLWVDQICINQENTDERNAQVRCMADIYKLASRVIVWLGQAAMFYEDDFDIAIDPDNINIDSDGTTIDSNDTTIDSDDITGDADDVIIDADLHMLWRGKTIQSWLREWVIFGRPWFFRQWVFQEAVFARRISFLLGTASLDFATLSRRLKSLDEFLAENRAQSFIHDHSFYLYLNEDFISLLEDTRPPTRASWWPGSARLQVRNSEDLVTILFALNAQQCQDPRDKIFSLTGIASNVLPVDFVNYDRPAASVFQDLSRHIVQESKSLEALTYLDRNIQEQRPTWVVHWGEGVSQGLIGLHVKKPSASLGRKWRPSLPVMDGQLRVSGKIIDSIATKIQSFRVNTDRYLKSRFASVLRQPYYEFYVQSSRADQSEHYAMPTKAAISSNEEMAITSELVSDRISGTPQESFSHFFNTIFPERQKIESDFINLIQEPTNEHSLVRLAELADWGLHRSSELLVLKSGRLGLVTNPWRGPREGDVIAILHGLGVPCVLRKSEDGEGWLFIADIYIHDIMHGEAVDWDEDEADTFVLV
ncbi:hypothetical protein E8E13_010107 [Curvularia kusanoi]|uniref:Heterokaryon incompatibility domain-containing protein n=1 Tax=Curvularia kusanoi TaxID=90978 RepID=A0A9P4TMA8_CURKU|nr:hypothetical protein E8E13_010107 [Curvularia kusanoi]